MTSDLCMWPLSHRNRLHDNRTCGCACWLPKRHVGPHLCDREIPANDRARIAATRPAVSSDRLTDEPFDLHADEEPGLDGTPAWAYNEDGYCVACGNGRWKYHMPGCVLADSLEDLARLRVENGALSAGVARNGTRWEAERALADRLAEALRGNLNTPRGRERCFDALAAYDEARRDRR